MNKLILMFSLGMICSIGIFILMFLKRFVFKGKYNKVVQIVNIALHVLAFVGFIYFAVVVILANFKMLDFFINLN